MLVDRDVAERKLIGFTSSKPFELRLLQARNKRQFVDVMGDEQ